MTRWPLAVGIAALAGAILYVELRLPVVPEGARAPEEDRAREERLADVERSLERLARAVEAIEERQALASELAAREPRGPEKATAEPADAPEGESANREEKLRRVKAFLANLETGRVTAEEIDEIWSWLPGSGMEDDAVAAFEAYVKAHPDDADAHYGLGMAITVKFFGGKASQLEIAALSARADREFTKALEIDDHHFSARYTKAFSYTFWPEFLGKGPEAIRHFEILRERHGGDTSKPLMREVYYNLGNEYRKAGNFDKAREVYEEALKYYPDAENIRKQYEAMQR